MAGGADHAPRGSMPKRSSSLSRDELLLAYRPCWHGGIRALNQADLETRSATPSTGFWSSDAEQATRYDVVRSPSDFLSQHGPHYDSSF